MCDPFGAVVAKNEKAIMSNINHDSKRHFGVDRTATLICEHYYYYRSHSWRFTDILQIVLSTFYPKDEATKLEGEFYLLPPGNIKKLLLIFD